MAQKSVVMCYRPEADGTYDVAKVEVYPHLKKMCTLNQFPYESFKEKKFPFTWHGIKFVKKDQIRNPEMFSRKQYQN